MKGVDWIILVLAFGVVFTLVMPIGRGTCLHGEALHAYEKLVMAAVAVISGYVGSQYRG